MTGYESKRAAAQDKLAHLTFEQRCRISEQCLPEAPYREMLIALHDEMLAALAQPEPRAYLAKVLEDDDDTPVYSADTAIVQMLLPKLYSIIDRLLDGQDKALVIEARRVLPKTYKNSFEGKT